MSPKKARHTTVSIPEPLYTKVQKRLAGTGFTSVSSFTTFLLREYLTMDVNDEDHDSIKEKLQKLEYL